MEPQSKSRLVSALPFWLVLLALSILINYIDRGNLANLLRASLELPSGGSVQFAHSLV
jgi:hypothetical protein